MAFPLASLLVSQMIAGNLGEGQHKAAGKGQNARVEFDQVVSEVFHAILNFVRLHGVG
jgi:hypothetical protein